MTPLLFIAVVALSLVLLYVGTGKDTKLLIIFSVFQLVVGLIASTGLFLEKPHFFPLLILAIAGLVIYSLKRIERQNVNETVLLSIHTLRIPVEVVLFQLFLDGKIPELMTFNGWNFDIVIGMSALILLIYTLAGKKNISRNILKAWNVIGLAFLSFIVVLSVLSAPLKIQLFAFDQPNIAVAEMPYCFLPTCVVPIVFLSHILLFQKNRLPSNASV